MCEFKDFASQKDKNFQIINLLQGSICSHSDFDERIFRCMIGVNQNMKQTDKDNNVYNKSNYKAN
ncbi:hypothetical protein TTHERM_000266528 (macronuclear) [Tetrahymena thermophila SB210]|uniref:Uncharacterized protein n=1 Tax=Tetrahymena thermophila (strain SB210) TaxID=312017 RepID=W7XAL8_TETTS|nr:hypothetical protein TTHERM_000266528 [Tetrahymena thermophila SB210]EWS74377.1 hypothetical protein TTHERM_000266528 [Tetrahymena thermophila SB210]|eukprot:XP_012653054.1 hypothetical protein TTHERM_000266528 [Tetrahymena thermophila SB210]